MRVWLNTLAAAAWAFLLVVHFNIHKNCNTVKLYYSTTNGTTVQPMVLMYNQQYYSKQWYYSQPVALQYNQWCYSKPMMVNTIQCYITTSGTTVQQWYYNPTNGTTVQPMVLKYNH